ncbi:MAG: UDP-N-acetylmuramate--L-alanine ligase [Candidatus Limnocylindria bacterium]
MTRFHIVGIGGMGMSAVARLLMARGDSVSGSDKGEWPLARALAADGATVATAFDPRNVGDADVVVRSSAYGDANPEIAAARAAGKPVWRRQDAWRELARGKRVVAVAGTHGKSTTTALAWTALRAGGLDPSLICGAVLRDIGTNAYAGRGDVLVIEADEYDRAFLLLEPEIAIVTNIEHDHIDVFPTHDDVKQAFARFASAIVRGGWLVACADDLGAAELARRGAHDLAGRQVATYGMAPDAGYRVVALVQSADGVSFDLSGLSGSTLSVSLRLAGAHNARNAAGALVAADALGVPAVAAARSFATFGGTERRLEELGAARGITVVDDYAHHPTEIRASIEAVRARTTGRVIVLFQPHTPSRLRAFFDEFAAALRMADDRVVAETFASAREEADSRAGAKALAKSAGGTYVADTEAAARVLAERARPGDLVLVLGAGDIRPAGIRLLELLRERATV